MEVVVSSQGDAFGSMVGTLAYMAPEVFTGEDATVVSDLYATGVMMYEMFTGLLPFHNKDIAALLENILMKEPDWIPLPYELRPVLKKLLAKDPAQRYASAQVVMEALHTATNRPLPQETIVLRESLLQASEFVGRKEDLRKLRRAMSATANGKGSMWLIAGESGVGKSRLIDELRAIAMVQGARVLRGQAIAEGGAAFQIWREPFRRLVLEVEITNLEAGILTAIVPDINKLIDRTVDDVPQLEGRSHRDRLVNTMIDVFSRITVPTLLILEDLQWSAESLSVLQQIVAMQEKFAKLMIVGSFRDDERPELKASLPDFNHMKLERLARKDIVSLGQSMLGELEQNDPLVDLVMRETEGNAFFIIEVVRFLAERAGSLDDIRGMTLPGGVVTGGMQHVLQRRIQRVSTRFNRLLQLTAVAGREIDVALLEHLAKSENNEPLNIADFLQEASEANVFDVADNHWRFEHDKLREAVLSEIPEQQRPTLHRNIAEAIEVLYPENPDYYDALLEHWHAAEVLERELFYSTKLAAHYLNVICEYERGHLLVARSLSRTSEDDIRRIELLNLQARAYWRIGDHHTTIEIAQKARQLAEKHNDIAAQAMSGRQLGLAYMQLGRFEESRQQFEASSKLYETVGDRVGLSSNFLNMAVISFLSGEVDAALRDAGKGYELSKVLKLPSHTITALQLMAAASARINKPEDSIRYFEEAENLSESIGDRAEMARTLLNQGVLYKEMGNYTEARQRMDRSKVLWEALGAKGELISLNSNLTELLIKLNEYDAAREAITSALQYASQLRSDRLLISALANAAEFLLTTQKQPQQAAMLLAIVLHHPQSDSEAKNDAKRVLPLLQTALSQEQIDQITAATHPESLYEQTEKVLGLLRET